MASPTRAKGAPRLARLLALIGALGAGCSSGTAAPPRQAPFDEGRAWAHLEHLVSLGPRPPGSEALEATRRYLSEQLAALGLEPVREPFTARTPLGPIEMANVYADLPGEGEAPPIVVLCTHFDTKRFDFEFVGANDGGSGTAVLLEIARLLAKGPPRPVTYRFLFLDGEEALRPVWVDPDNTYGSRHHVEQLRKSGLLQRIGACVLLDMVGDADLRLNRDLNSDPKLLELFFEAAREAGLGRHVDGRREAVRDDHIPFLRAGIAAVDLIDLEYGPDRSYWHTAEDTLEHCSRQSLGVIGRIVMLGLPRLETWLEER